MDFVRLHISIRWVDAGPFPRLHPHEIGSSVRKAARPRVCTHVRAVPRDSSPYGINQVKKTCRKVLTLGSAHPACFVPLLARRGLSCYPRHPYRASPERHVLPRDLLVWIYPTDERAILLCERLKWTRGIEGRTKKKRSGK